MNKPDITAPVLMTPELKNASVRGRDWTLDRSYLTETLERLLLTPSPSGMTDAVVNLACEMLDQLGIEYELTRRGAVRATLPGETRDPDRAIVAHLDTLGAMVKCLKPNGRCEVAPIGHWSSRFAEGARVTIQSENGSHHGTILPNKASGHVYNREIDTQPCSWDNVELRVDRRVHSARDLADIGIAVGDTVVVHANPTFSSDGFVCSRHLDDKAGVAALLTAVKALKDAKLSLPLECHLLLTISEEVGVGASHVLHGDVAEMVSIDNGTIAPGQNTSEYGATVAMQDMGGPFDWHLTRKLLKLADAFGIDHSRDVFKYYRSDAAAALEAGNDIRTALVCFACDASHGWERTNLDSLEAVADLMVAYMRSPLLFHRDEHALGPREDFPETNMVERPA
ncbi:MAG: osmoprotectant NAGGN system M42 family peptidase [Rhodospirillales bacterium]